jgi:predicted permease
LTIASAVLALVAPALLGVLAGAVRLYPEPSAAVDPLNRYALYVAFPALLAQALLGADLVVPSSPGFWLLVPGVLAICAAAARKLVRREAPTLGLILSFGNIAFLGFPIVEQTLGPRAMPIASFAVVIHVLLAITVGPTLLLRWSGQSGGGAQVLSRLRRHPLLWAPIAALAARALPEVAREALAVVLTPLGRSAPPVSLFLLGLYLHAHGERARRLDRADLVHVVGKVVVMPAVTLGLAWVMRQVGAIEPLEAQVLAVLSAMPAAITTFAMAHEHGVGAEQTSRAVVGTSLASTVAIPLTVLAARALLG